MDLTFLNPFHIKDIGFQSLLDVAIDTTIATGEMISDLLNLKTRKKAAIFAPAKKYFRIYAYMPITTSDKGGYVAFSRNSQGTMTLTRFRRA